MYATFFSIVLTSWHANTAYVCIKRHSIESLSNNAVCMRIHAKTFFNKIQVEKHKHIIIHILNCVICTTARIVHYLHCYCCRSCCCCCCYCTACVCLCIVVKWRTYRIPKCDYCIKRTEKRRERKKKEKSPPKKAKWCIYIYILYSEIQIDRPLRVLL